MVRYRSAAKKPETGMEMSVTFHMPAGLTAEQNAEALVKFFEAINAASDTVGSTWLRIWCAGIPAEYEGVIAKALDDARAVNLDKARHGLRLIVDNTEQQ
jgi:hypothetical protein